MNIIWESTGIVRSPNAGEWFRGTNGVPTQAMFDFGELKFEILIMRVVEERVK